MSVWFLLLVFNLLKHAERWMPVPLWSILLVISLMTSSPQKPQICCTWSLQVNLKRLHLNEQVVNTRLHYWLYCIGLINMFIFIFMVCFSISFILQASLLCFLYCIQPNFRNKLVLPVLLAPNCSFANSTAYLYVHFVSHRTQTVVFFDCVCLTHPPTHSSFCCS